MSLLVKVFVSSFLMAFSILGQCALVKTEHFQQYEYIATAVLNYLVSNDMVSKKDGKLKPGFYPEDRGVYKLGLIRDESQGRFFLDVVNTDSSGSYSDHGIYSGELFEYRNNKIISEGKYDKGQGLFDNKPFDDLKLRKVLQIFTVEESDG